MATVKDFDISNDDLHRTLSSSGKEMLNCNVLFPDGTIVENAKISRVTTDIVLVITIHGVEFQDWVGTGMPRLRDLKYQILTE